MAGHTNLVETEVSKIYKDMFDVCQPLVEFKCVEFSFSEKREQKSMCNPPLISYHSDIAEKNYISFMKQRLAM